MKTYKLLTCIVASFMLLSITPNESFASKNPTPKPAETKTELSIANQLRIDEINAMDKSNLTAAEKKELRAEVKEIKKAVNGGGVYISVGGLIIILLLLVILL